MIDVRPDWNCYELCENVVCFVAVVMHKDKEDGMHRSRDLTAFDHTLLDGEMFLQALNGFLMILTCEGEVFFATHSIEGYLGFHQVNNPCLEW